MMNFFSLLSRSMQNNLFIQTQLNSAHTLIEEYQLPVQKLEDDFYAQFILLENYAGVNYFQRTLARYRRLNAWMLVLAVSILGAAAIIFGIEYTMPEWKIADKLMDYLFEHFLPVIIGLTALFLLVIVLQFVRIHYANKLMSTAVNSSWRAILQKVESSLDLPANSTRSIAEEIWGNH
ncbi:hypothetical protein DCC85_07605 [Paenibacillus sp. CAA11]|uniref:DUF6097 family protein n=1 Tax=Paenibacillus sp. CAA11 TaxID=1532905 RepID=UPI000D3852ED|nr:DUF6097 family protein [Paenibacillus sp. CAA11]AWB44096.1 hypothetical protein DCC85_07605 [Paenibacillus sp. CAA11]